MANNKSIITFGLQEQHSLSENLTSQEDWFKWLSDSSYKSEQKTPVNRVPAMMRRRMSLLSKMAVQVALELLERTPVDYIVFSSRHGELPRTVELIESILSGDDASPTAFSQSVHNTAAGITTIAAKQSIPVTSLAAGEDSFHQALIEAFIYLDENPTNTVLLVDFDAPLPEVYAAYQDEEMDTYAVGLVLTSGRTYRVSWTTIPSAQKSKTAWPQSIDCLRHLLLDNDSWTVHSSKKQWEWSK
jgi:hypothetical protein